MFLSDKNGRGFLNSLQKIFIVQWKLLALSPILDVEIVGCRLNKYSELVDSLIYRLINTQSLIWTVSACTLVAFFSNKKGVEEKLVGDVFQHDVIAEVWRSSPTPHFLANKAAEVKVETVQFKFSVQVRNYLADTQLSHPSEKIFKWSTSVLSEGKAVCYNCYPTS